MKYFTGTSGFSYPEWKGSFYPEDLSASEMLAFYGARFNAVEINNTFYRMPRESVLQSWSTQVPDDFAFVLKAPQRITHRKRLVDAGDDLEYFFKVSSALGTHLGPVLFQLPPFLRKDVERLRSFLTQLPPHGRYAFEFRHETWIDEETLDALAEHEAVLCHSDADGADPVSSLPRATASWGYLRLRRTSYTEEDLRSWLKRIAAQGWREAWVFFKHEDEGTGPALVSQFMKLQQE